MPCVINQIFGSAIFSKLLQNTDFIKFPILTTQSGKEKALIDAESIAENSGSLGCNLKRSLIKSKPTFSISKIEEKLVVRKCLKNLRCSYLSKTTHRSQITQELKTILCEGIKYRIYKLDIRAFFESIYTPELLKKLDHLSNLSKQTKIILNNLLSNFNLIYGPGIPRGIEVASFLADYYLSDFDAFINSLPSVLYHARYVDDLIIITPGKEDPNSFIGNLVHNLPEGLSFRNEKTQFWDIPERSKTATETIVGEFNYLGYHFKIIDTPTNEQKLEFRRISINLSQERMQRFKKRIVQAFYAFTKDNNFRLLISRIQFLSTNRQIPSKNQSNWVPIGIYYNYPKLDLAPDCLKEIDRFLTSMIFSSKGRLGSKIKQKLNQKQKRKLLGLSFSKGHSKRIFKRFSPNFMKEIVKIWQ